MQKCVTVFLSVPLLRSIISVSMVCLLYTSEEGDVLGEDGYTMKVDLEPGDYHLITWAGLNNEASFSVPLVTAGESRCV